MGTPMVEVYGLVWAAIVKSGAFQDKDYIDIRQCKGQGQLAFSTRHKGHDAYCEMHALPGGYFRPAAGEVASRGKSVLGIRFMLPTANPDAIHEAKSDLIASITALGQTLGHQSVTAWYIVNSTENELLSTPMIDRDQNSTHHLLKIVVTWNAGTPAKTIQNAL